MFNFKYNKVEAQSVFEGVRHLYEKQLKEKMELEQEHKVVVVETSVLNNPSILPNSHSVQPEVKLQIVPQEETMISFS